MRINGIYQYSKKINYAPKCYLKRDFGVYKDYQIMISRNYVDKCLLSKLYNIKDSAGNLIKSKLKYFSGGKVWKTLKGGINA